MDRIKHRDDVLRRYFRQNVVNGIENEAPTGGEDLQPLFDMIFNLLWSGMI